MKPVGDSARDAAAEFYDARFREGYMADWPEPKKRRVVEIIGSQDLPPTPSVLDFGCGQGAFMAALKNQYPDWQIAGCEISTVALDLNRERLPNLTFYSAAQLGEAQFDLVYSHHVLEHVYDLDEVVAQMAQLVRPGGLVLNVLPCGDHGSLERRLAGAVKHGIDPENGRFYYEEPGHLRRLTTTQLAEVAAPHGLRLRDALYASQFWGGVEFLTFHKPQLLAQWLDPRLGNGTNATVQLLGWAAVLIPLSAARVPARVIEKWQRGMRAGVLNVLLVPSAIAWPASYAVDRALQSLREREWQMNKHRPGGSEMYLLFERL
jgi:SAM-dependent methyltransferase